MALEVVRWEPPFSYAGRATRVDYQPAAPATRRWTLCVVFPHIKDAYWQAVNHGMIDAAQRLGVALRFAEAGGYPNLARQRELVRACADAPEVDAIILGTVSFDGLTDELRRASLRKPVLATVNDIADEGLSAKVGVPYHDMGYQIGRYLAARHPAGAAPVPVAWFPGPDKAGWVPFVDRGFRAGIAGSALEIVAVGWGDTDKNIQRNLVQGTLDAHPEVRYLVGNAMMAEAAISVLRERRLDERIGIVSSYLTPGVYRGIVRHKILAAPSDSPVVQGHLSIDQAVAILEGRSYEKHIGPVVKLIEPHTASAVTAGEAMPPPTFTPQFGYEPPGAAQR